MFGYRPISQLLALPYLQAWAVWALLLLSPLDNSENAAVDLQPWTLKIQK